MLVIMRVLPVVALAFLIAGCASRKAPPAPDITAPAISVDRDALPGGTLRVLPVAMTQAPGHLVVQGADSAVQQLPVFVYVFEHPTQGVVLIDAGFPRRTSVDFASYPGRSQAKTLGLSMDPGGAAVDRLSDAGLEAAAVSHVVLTHMHPDHVGGIEDFPGATLVVTSDEWAAREKGGALGKPDTSPFVDHAKIDQVALDQGAFGPFAAHRDLFGDGSLLILDTPGHTAGHVSVLLNLRGTTFLFTGDAAWTDPHWTPSPQLKSPLVRGLLEHDWKANWDTQWRIRAFADANRDVIVVAGHEVANLTRLRAWPEAYE